jgi:hypothetical protein
MKSDGDRMSATFTRGNPTLLGAAMNKETATWPTPTGSDGDGGLSEPDPKWPKGTRNLSEAVHAATMTAEPVLLWPTATATPYGTGQNGCPGDGRESFAGKGAPRLQTLAQRWATPTASDDDRGPRAPESRQGSPNLTDMAAAETPTMKTWPTATTTDAKASRRHGYMIDGNSGTTLHDAIDTHPSAETPQDGSTTSGRAVLNPHFVTALVGLPAGWIDLPMDTLRQLYAKTPR